MMEIAANLFESVLFVVFLTFFLQPGKKKRIFFCYALGAAVLLFLNIICSDYFSVFSVFTILIDFLIAALFWRGCLEGNFSEFFTGFALYWFGISSSSYLTAYLLYIVDTEAVLAIFSPDSLYRTGGLLLSKSLLLLFVGGILYYRKRFRYYHNQILFCCYVVIPVIVLSIFMMVNRTIVDLYCQEPEIGGRIIYIVVGLCGMFLMILVLAADLSRRQQKEQEVLRLKEMVRIQKQSLQNYVKEEREQSKRKHELENQFFSVQFLISQGNFLKGMEVLQKMIGGMCGTAGSVTISENIIDTVIDNKQRKYAKFDIDIQKKVVIKTGEKMELEDLCILTGNLVENALEAAVRSKERKVRIDVREQYECLHLMISNTFSPAESDVENFLTKKKDAGMHGFGRKSIKEIVNKYRGTMETGHEGSWFYTEVMIYYQI